MDPGTGVLLDAAAGLPAQDAQSLARGVTGVLTSACRAHDLWSLSLQVAGRPDLAMDVHRGPRSPSALVAWAHDVPACEWHDGLLLVATAAQADPARRAAVAEAAGILSELVTVHRRRWAAEALAERAVELAGRDALTDLGNRRTWRRAVDAEALRSRRYGGSSSVVIVDLNDLKKLNDAHGHAAGDVHLQKASAALQAACRTVDVVCRLGGDEFAVLAPETDSAGAARLVDRLRHELDEAGVRASLGAATADSGDVEAAWHAADAAMYLDKQRSRGGARPYDLDAPRAD